MKLPTVFAVSALCCAAQVCGPAPDIAAAIQELVKLPAMEVADAAIALRDKYPDSLWAQRAHINTVHNRDALIAEYSKALGDHPGDANYLYYRGATLIGVNSELAIKYLQQALEKNPDLTPAHAGLVEIYGSSLFADAAGLRSHLASFLKACPETDLSFYTYLERVDGPDLVRDRAVDLRKILGAREDPNSLIYYRLLWGLEFKTRPPSEHEQQRVLLRQDLERLRQLGLHGSGQLGETLRVGYRLLGDKDGLAWVDQQIRPMPSPLVNPAPRTPPATGRNGTFLDRTLVSIENSPDPSGATARGEPAKGDLEPEPEPLPGASPRALVYLNEPLPGFTLQDLTGKSWTLAEIHGKATLINVWATWCGPCRKELPLVQALYDRVKDRSDLEVITLNVDEKQGSIAPFLKKNNFTFPVLRGNEYAHSVVTRLSIPRTWIVDKDGIVRSISIGVGSTMGSLWVDRTIKTMEKLGKPARK